MRGLFRRKPLPSEVRFETPAHEPTAAERQLDWYQRRITAASQIVVDRLNEQHRLEADDRDLELIDALLDIRSALRLGPSGREIPVVPGGEPS